MKGLKERLFYVCLAFLNELEQILQVTATMGRSIRDGISAKAGEGEAG